MNLNEYLARRSDTDRPSVDGVLAYAPWLTRERATHWRGVIAADARAGRYTTERMFEIAELIIAERGDER